jgi:two-component system KDP operon response regulator KdpE
MAFPHGIAKLSKAMSMNPEKVLIVAEDASLCLSLRKTLEEFKLDCGEASNENTAMMRLRMIDYDAVLMDLPASALKGIEACRQIRSVHPRLPILILSDCDNIDNKVDALEAGADDYICKPFAAREIIARLRSAVRRLHSPVFSTTEPFVVGDIVLDPVKRRVAKAGSEVSLTPLEFRTLHALMEQAGRPVAHGVLLATLWGQESRQHREHLRVVIGGLRRKLEDNPTHPLYLVTYNYFGYCFRDR